MYCIGGRQSWAGTCLKAGSSAKSCTDFLIKHHLSGILIPRWHAADPLGQSCPPKQQATATAAVLSSPRACLCCKCADASLLRKPLGAAEAGCVGMTEWCISKPASPPRGGRHGEIINKYPPPPEPPITINRQQYLLILLAAHTKS